MHSLFLLAVCACFKVCRADGCSAKTGRGSDPSIKLILNRALEKKENELMKEETIDTRITEAALSGDGFLIVKLEDERRKRQAQEFARQCRALQDRLDEIKDERASAVSEREAFSAQLEIAAQEWRRAKDIEDARRLEHAQLQLKLSYLDTKLDILREEERENSQQLRESLAERR